jgi:DGQHR domain-containing protein
MRIPVVEGQTLHSGVRIVTGSIPVKLLARLFEVPYRDALKKKGYQRKPQDVRINRFANELLKGQTDVPTSVLLNIREGEDELFNEDSNGMFLDFDALPKHQKKLYVVDGQHRILAFEKLYSDNPEKWGDHRLQFVLMLGASEQEEVNQFYIVNTTAKSVKTDLALDLLKQRAEADGRVRPLKPNPSKLAIRGISAGGMG